MQLKFKLKGQNKNKGLCCHKEREQNYINELEVSTKSCCVLKFILDHRSKIINVKMKNQYYTSSKYILTRVAKL